MASEGGKIDPMHQFMIEPIVPLNLAGYDISFTNSSLFMILVMATIWVFMLGGMKRQMVPGRWQAAVEGVNGFVNDMVSTSVGPEGKKYVPLVFSLFMFILVANFMGMMPFGIVPGGHAFTVTSHLTVTAVLAILSFGTVLVVGFWKHKLHFFSLFVPHGTPWWLMWLIPPVPCSACLSPVKFPALNCAAMLTHGGTKPRAVMVAVMNPALAPSWRCRASVRCATATLPRSPRFSMTAKFFSTTPTGRARA